MIKGYYLNISEDWSSNVSAYKKNTLKDVIQMSWEKSRLDVMCANYIFADWLNIFLSNMNPTGKSLVIYVLGDNLIRWDVCISSVTVVSPG